MEYSIACSVFAAPSRAPEPAGAPIQMTPGDCSKVLLDLGAQAFDDGDRRGVMAQYSGEHRPSEGRAVDPRRRAVVGALAAALLAGCARRESVGYHSPTHPTRPLGRTPDAVGEQLTARAAWARLAAGNARFAAGKAEPMRRRSPPHPGPFACLFTCSELFPAPEVLFDTAMGDVVTVRSAAHVLDSGALAGIEHGVVEHSVRLVLLVGHTDCWFVQAAIDRTAGVRSASRQVDAAVHAVAAAVGRTPRGPVTDFTGACAATHAVRTARRLRGASEVLGRPSGSGTPWEAAADAGEPWAEVLPVLYDPDLGLIRRLHARRPWHGLLGPPGD